MEGEPFQRTLPYQEMHPAPSKAENGDEIRMVEALCQIASPRAIAGRGSGSCGVCIDGCPDRPCCDRRHGYHKASEVNAAFGSLGSSLVTDYGLWPLMLSPSGPARPCVRRFADTDAGSHLCERMAARMQHHA